MDELQTRYIEPNILEISRDGADVAWRFYIMLDRSGRRHLDGPHGSKESMAHGELLQRVCTFAHAEAIHAGKVDY